MYSFIYINAEEVASNYYGYNSFDVNISRFFKKNQDIEITVLVINRLQTAVGIRKAEFTGKLF